LSVLNEITTEDGLCDNNIYCIQPGENGKLWLTTARGLSVYDTALHRFSNYYHQQGLQSHEFNLFGKTSCWNRTLYFSSTEGIVQVRPYTWEDTAPHPLHTIITKVLIGNELFGKSELSLVNERRGFIADYGLNISLTFAVVNYLPSLDHTLQYKLSNNDGWVDILPGSEIILSQLSPGEYTMQVRGMLKAGNITGEPLTLSLYIKAAYYQQWWFIVMVCMIVAGIAYSTYKFRINQINKVSTLRTRISRDLHDNVGAALSSISIYSQAAIQKIESGNMVESKSILQRIGETSREVIADLNETVWLINPGNDNLQKVVQRITQYALPLCRAKDIRFEVEADFSLENLNIDVDKKKVVYMFLKEAINNSLKYAEANTLIIGFKKDNKTFHISVSDNGTGILEEKPYSGNGLSNMKQRAKDVNGKIEINSAHLMGTKIVLHL